MAEPAPTTIPVGESLKAGNDRQARANRELFRSHGLLVLNLLSSPGSGKTALLERTLSEYGKRRRVGVIVGDLQTDNDARRPPCPSARPPTPQNRSCRSPPVRGSVVASSRTVDDFSRTDPFSPPGPSRSGGRSAAGTSGRSGPTRPSGP